MDESVGPAARSVEREEDPDERNRVEEVALLDPVTPDAVRGRLEKQGGDKGGGECTEGELLAGARPLHREPEAEGGARCEHDAGGEGEQHRIGPEPLGQLG